MSLSRQCVVLARALIAWGLVDQRTLEDCAQDVHRVASKGGQTTLGQVLVGRGFLSVPHYQAIVGQLHHTYTDNSQLQQIPFVTESGRYTQTYQRPSMLDSSTVDRAVNNWQQVAEEVTASGSSIEIDFDSPPAPPQQQPQQQQPPAAAPGRDRGKRAPADRMIRRQLKIPDHIDRFPIGTWVIEDYLDAGNWGIVYRVSHNSGHPQPYALKILKHFNPTEEIRQRFVQEARTMAKLSHPGIVHVHDAGVVGGLLWFVMDFMPGKNLKDQLEDDGAIGYQEARRVIGRLCDAVSYAHGQSILHRDLKPDNVIMRDGHEPVLTDFGLAKDNQSEMNLTREGQRIGTPLYMAPELLLGGGAATVQSEVYSLGAILYQCLTGKVPFFAKSMFDLADMIEKGNYVPLKKAAPDAPKSLEDLLKRSLNKEPDQRPASVRDFATQLENAR